MRVVISGSTGFVGSHLVTVLTAIGIEVLPITLRDDADTILNLNTLIAHPEAYISQDDVLVHLAAIVQNNSETNPEKIFEINYHKSSKLLNVGKQLKIRKMIVLGSLKELGSFPVDADSSEKLDDYTKSKIMLANYVMKDIDIPFTYIRSSSIFGVGSKVPSLDGCVRESCDTKAKLILKNPSSVRDFVNICDIVQYIIGEIISVTGNEFVNFCSGENTTVFDFAKKVFDNLLLEDRPDIVKLEIESNKLFNNNKNVKRCLPEVAIQKLNLQPISKLSSLELYNSLYTCRCSV
jgi:nucleoside-diphosphate-sugar epimerase